MAAFWHESRHPASHLARPRMKGMPRDFPRRPLLALVRPHGPTLARPLQGPSPTVAAHRLDSRVDPERSCGTIGRSQSTIAPVDGCDAFAEQSNQCPPVIGWLLSREGIT